LAYSLFRNGELSSIDDLNGGDKMLLINGQENRFSEPVEQQVTTVDELTNAVLSTFPVHCAFRTYPINQPYLHSHHGFELYLCLSGSCRFIAGDRVHHVSSGTLLVVKPMVLHMPRSPEGEEFQRFVLAIESSCLERLYEGDETVGAPIQRWLPGPNEDSVHWQLNARQLLSLQDTLVELEKEIAEMRDSYPLAVQSLLLKLFVGLNRHHTEPVPAENKNEDRIRLVEKILGYMLEHYREPFQTEDLCRQFHLSRSYLHRIFKLQTGVSINEFLTAYRVNNAKELLTHSELPLTEVAASVGFQDLSHFFHTFKKLTGVTPGRFRSSFTTTYRGGQ
jgi:AraC-like DNA-binding protein/mannose-6-phosphate isomerase-like protein (cupin superfamily)